MTTKQLKKLVTVQERLRQKMHGKDYSFIAPTDAKLFENFIKTANLLGPSNMFNMSIHPALSDKNVTEQALINVLQKFPNAHYDIFIIPGKYIADRALIHSDLESYAKTNDIDLEELTKDDDDQEN